MKAKPNKTKRKPVVTKGFIEDLISSDNHIGSDKKNSFLDKLKTVLSSGDMELTSEERDKILQRILNDRNW